MEFGTWAGQEGDYLVQFIDIQYYLISSRRNLDIRIILDYSSVTMDLSGDETNPSDDLIPSVPGPRTWRFYARQLQIWTRMRPFTHETVRTSQTSTDRSAELQLQIGDRMHDRL
jgi:hypothetical protein